MARLFFQRPAFGALDECTNATSADVEEALYAHARQLGITLVTVTQRTALVSATVSAPPLKARVHARTAL